jgi:predicted dehydrogenase
MKVAFVGSGYVADSYAECFSDHPELELVGIHDRDPEREERFASFHGLRAYGSLEALLDDSSIDIVANLTNPASHFEVSRACIEAGRHVYSEKPLAMDVGLARELIALAEARGVRLSGAPCTILGEAAQTVWRAVREGDVGQPRLVYAEIEDGPVDLMGLDNLRSASGMPWPYQDEFNVGCTLEHAGYYLSWLCAFFGPAERVTAFSTCLKPTRLGVEVEAPDLSVACIQFRSGVVARLTNGIYAPHDHRFQVIGDEGRIFVDNCWHFGAPVYVQRYTQKNLKAAGHPISKVPLAKELLGVRARKRPPVRATPLKYKTWKYWIDFARGISEFADAIREDRPSRLSPDFLLHINELALGISAASSEGATFEVESDFRPIEPMPWG